MKQHPLSAIFPAMPEAEYIDLKSHISEHGQQSAIALLNGQVLDGWHRWRACSELGLTPKTRELPAKTDALAFVLGQNLNRRHLNESQRAMVAAKIANLPHGRSEKNKHSHVNLTPPVTQAKAAEMLNVSTHSVSSAKQVLDANPNLASAVASGKVAVRPAAEQVRAKKEAAKEVHRDATGYVIPDKLMPLWNRRQEVRDVQNEIAGAIRKVKAAHEKPDLLWKSVNLQAIEIALNNCKRDLDLALPYAVCCTCQGRSPDSCASCKGRGFISKHHFDNTVPEEIKVIREKSCVR